MNRVVEQMLERIPRTWSIWRSGLVRAAIGRRINPSQQPRCRQC